jgi:uncharacterized protein
VNLQYLESKCLEFAHQKCTKTDSAHDILHAKRVLKIVKRIQKKEGGKLKILIPAALFHDIVIYPKNHRKSDTAQRKSAIVAERFLKKSFGDYFSDEEIKQVFKIIEECSFSKNIKKTCLEGKILQDADSLEAMGSIAIMRSFHSGGQMNRPFYSEIDPFCKHRKPEPKIYTVDLFYARSFKIKERLELNESIKIANAKEKILYRFILNLKKEI